VAHYQRDCFWQGDLPLWNPYNHCGLPFLAQWNTMALYPFALSYLLLPLQWSLSVFCLAHLFWGGLGMYFLARAWTGNRLAAGLAGVIFAFNGLSLNFLMWPSHEATFSWFPWVVLLVLRGCRDGRRAMAWAVLAGSAQMLAGGPETILLTWIVLILLGVGSCVWEGLNWRLAAPRFLGIALLVALVCAAQLLPFLQLAAHSQRDSGFGSSDWSMPASGFANLLVPLLRTSPSGGSVWFQPSQYWTSSYYAGVGTLLLWAVAIRRGGNWRIWLLAVLVALALVLALGDSGLIYRGLRYCLPGIGFVRYPVKYVILALALAPLLAAFGARALICSTVQVSRFTVLAAGALLALVCAVSFIGWAFPAGEFRTQPLLNGLWRGLFFVIMVWLTAKLLRASSGPRVLVSCLLLLTVWLDFVTHVPRQNPDVRPLALLPNYTAGVRAWAPAPKLGESRAMISPFADSLLRRHIIGDLEQNYTISRLALLADCNLLESLPQTYGFFSLAPQEINNVVALPYVRTNSDYSAMLDFMGVSQITAPGEVYKWAARPSAMPLVTAGQQALFVDDNSAYELLTGTNLDLHTTVMLPPEAANSVTTNRCVAARILKADFKPQSVSVEVEAPSASMVVISQSYYPAWKATVDDRPAKLWRANYAFQAVEVPAGQHSVRLVYRDKSFEFGLLVSAIGLLGCLVLWLMGKSGRGAG
jgi:hypothetical protein